MTVVGDVIIHNCRNCFSKEGYGINLHSHANGLFSCPQCSTKYVVKSGFMKTA